jgi:hypothetical protein
MHQFGHAMAAYLGGDGSVAEAGYLPLNPLQIPTQLAEFGRSQMLLGRPF